MYYMVIDVRFLLLMVLIEDCVRVTKPFLLREFCLVSGMLFSRNQVVRMYRDNHTQR